MLIEARHLQLVSAIRREGTLTQAAVSLHMTQPAASHALKTLERQLGLPLFSRGPKGMTPTQAGMRVLTAADRALPEIDRLEQDLAELAAGRRGIVRITTECYTCYHWLPRILNTFCSEFPGFDIQIVPEATRRPLEALLGAEVDLAILHTFPGRGDVLARELFRDEMLAVVAPEHPLAARKFLKPSDFRDQHLVLHHDFNDSVIATQWLIPAAIRPRKISELQLTEAVVEVVKSGLGMSVMADWAVRSEIDRGHLVGLRLSAGGLYRSWYAAILTQRSGDLTLSSLIDQLQGGALKVV